MNEIIKPFNVGNYRDQLSGADKNYVDWHSKHTILFGSLIDDGWDWGRNDWTSYSMKAENLELIRDRINEKIEDRYMFRELGVLPPARFKKHLKSQMNKIMDQQGPIYDRIIEGLDLFSITEEEVERTVLSEYPQAQLRTQDNDYASSAIENAKNIEKRQYQLDAIEKYNKSFIEPDEAVLENIGICFSRYISFSL